MQHAGWELCYVTSHSVTQSGGTATILNITIHCARGKDSCGRHQTDKRSGWKVKHKQEQWLLLRSLWPESVICPTSHDGARKYNLITFQKAKRWLFGQWNLWPPWLYKVKSEIYPSTLDFNSLPSIELQCWEMTGGYHGVGGLRWVGEIDEGDKEAPQNLNHNIN